MNPGGDFGKRELSPALRSRFTEIYIPNITDTNDIILVIQEILNLTNNFSIHELNLNNNNNNSIQYYIGNLIIEFITWFNNQTNSTLNGTTINHSINWTDNLALTGYIFSFDNGIGAFVKW